MRTAILPQNPILVALIFKDGGGGGGGGGGLANHPQGMFRNQENKINEKQRKKMQEKKSWRTYSALFFHQKPKVQCDASKPRGPLTTRQPAEYKWMSGYPTPLQKIGQSLLCTWSSTQIHHLHKPVPISPI